MHVYKLDQNEQFVEEQLSKFLDSFESHHHDKHAFPNHNMMANEFLRELNEPIPEEKFDKYYNQAQTQAEGIVFTSKSNLTASNGKRISRTSVQRI